MAEKLTEHTYGSSIYMKMRLENGCIEEITAYIRGTGWGYRTSADHAPEYRARIIRAFHDLY